MGEQVEMRAPKNYLRVDLSDPAEAEYWLVVMDTTRARLELALAAVGADAIDVRNHLQPTQFRISGPACASPRGQHAVRRG